MINDPHHLQSTGMVAAAQIKHLVPLESLTPSERNELVRTAKEGQYKANQVIFSRGDKTTWVPFILAGEVELVDTAGTRVVKADSPEGRHALSLGPTYQCTATCIKPATVVLINRDQLDLALTWSQTGSGTMEVSEVSFDGEGDDWMSVVLANPAFEKVPPANIALFFAALKPVSLNEKEVVIREGDPGDAYFIVTRGELSVVRRDAQGKAFEVSRLRAGNGFGEEALVSGNPRNATVVAREACELMRLDAADFEKLFKTPLLKEMELEDMGDDDELLDVRTIEEFKRGHLPGARNVPLADVRELASTLPSGRRYLVYCDTGRRSASATYLLRERGVDAAALRGGVEAADLCYLG